MLVCLARPAGLEPTTPWFVARCSNPTELRARESELYQKLDEADRSAHPAWPQSLHRPRVAGTLYAIYPASDVGRRDLRQIQCWEMFDLRQLLPRVCRFDEKARRPTRKEG